MGDSKRRKLSDPSYGKSYRATEAITHVIGIPDERLTGKYEGYKADMRHTRFDCMTPDVIKTITLDAKKQKLDRYVHINAEANNQSFAVSIAFVTDTVADLIDKKYLHSCAAQELADILAETDNPNNIKYLSVIHDEQKGEPTFMDLMKSTGLELFMFLTVHNISRL